jgi:hypothetical protein
MLGTHQPLRKGWAAWHGGRVSRFIRVRGTFVWDRTGEPLQSHQHSVRLYDLDMLRDDLLGDGGFIEHGVVEVLISLGTEDSWDSPGERMPDLYMVLYEGAREIYRTPVTFNVAMPLKELFTQQVAGLLDLGVFRVP